MRHYVEHSPALDMDKGTECPACNGPPKLLCLDGNQGLVRKKSSGLSVKDPSSKDYFLDQSKVDQFVKSYKKSSKQGGGGLQYICCWDRDC